jgi:8-oxo-dGTP diphosphatase
MSDESKAGDDAAESQWYSLNNLPDLAFDHDHIVEACYKKFQSNLLQKFWFLLFLNNEFSAEEIFQLLNNISELKFPVAKIQNILFNLPFIKKVNNKLTFLKIISNDDILKLDESKLINIWQNILKN